MRMVHVYDWINETCYSKRFECSNSVERCYRITNPQVFISFFLTDRYSAVCQSPRLSGISSAL